MNRWMVLFLLSLFTAIFSISQIVNAIKSVNRGGMFYLQIIVFILLFLIAMLLLSFGMYASERIRGRLTRRIEFFEIWLGKEKK
jgi:hypothetical protein